MKIKMNATFEGNLQELIQYMEETFKDANSLTLSVTIADKRMPVGIQMAVAHLRNLAPGMTRQIPEDTLRYGIDEAVRLAQQNLKIPALKQIREISGLGLKEAKDFVESPVFTCLYQ